MEHNSTVIILKALADEVRLGIVRKIAQRDETVSSCDIVESCSSFLKLSQPTMSHHFSKLVEASVLIQEKDGKSNKYRLNKALLDEIGIDVRKI